MTIQRDVGRVSVGRGARLWSYRPAPGHRYSIASRIPAILTWQRKTGTDMSGTTAWTHRNTALTCWGSVGTAPVRAPKRLNDLLRGARYTNGTERALYIMFFDQLLTEVLAGMMDFGEVYRAVDLTPAQQQDLVSLREKNLIYFTPCFEGCSYVKSDPGVVNTNSYFIFKGATGVSGFNEAQHEVLLPPGQVYKIESCGNVSGKFTVIFRRSGATREAENWNAAWLKLNELVLKSFGG